MIARVPILRSSDVGKSPTAGSGAAVTAPRGPHWRQASEDRLGTRGKVLVVDDDGLVLASVAAALEAAGFDVCATESGTEALALAEQHGPDAVVTDFRMPGMDGLALLEHLARQPRAMPRTAIVYSAVRPTGNPGAQWVPKASGHLALIDALTRAEQAAEHDDGPGR